MERWMVDRSWSVAMRVVFIPQGSLLTTIMERIAAANEVLLYSKLSKPEK